MVQSKEQIKINITNDNSQFDAKTIEDKWYAYWMEIITF
jgi:hypothetical protein